MTIKSLVVDDEPLARLNVRNAIDHKSNWKIVGELGSNSGLNDLIERTKPDVLFLDIEMPEEDGLSIAKRLLDLDDCPIIVFVTAYSEYAMDAFEVCAFDYILKPFNNERFFACLSRVENILNHSKKGLRRCQKNQLENFDSLKKIVIRSLGSIEIIKISEVLYLEASGNYVEIFHSAGSSLHRTSLSFLENRLNKKDFIRIHRSTIVKVDLIVKIDVIDDKTYLKLLNSNKKHKVSTTYKPHLLDALEIN